MNSCNILVRNIDSLTNQLKNKVDFKTLIPTVSKTIDSYTKLKEKLMKISEKNEIIKSINVARLEMSTSQDEVNKLSTLKAVLERINKLNQHISSINNKVADLNKEIEPVLKEYNTIKVCPYCGNKLHGKEEHINE